MIVNNSSIGIILKQYKEEHITEEEAIQLINDLTYNRTSYVPYYPWWNNNGITWETNHTFDSPKYNQYDVTCKHTEYDNNKMP